jgi:hypothetical protein
MTDTALKRKGMDTLTKNIGNCRSRMFYLFNAARTF